MRISLLTSANGGERLDQNNSTPKNSPSCANPRFLHLLGVPALRPAHLTNNKQKMQKILFYIILFPILLSAQQRKWDAVWMLGQGAKIGDKVFVNTRLDFNHDPVKVSGTTMGSFYFFDGNVSMCNSEGDLMFYSNMCDVANDLNSLPMEGGG